MNTTERKENRTASRLALIAAAAITSTLIWLVAELVGVNVAVTMGGSVHAVGGVTVAVSATIAGLGAWGVNTVTSRASRHATSWWLTISITVLVLSLLGPLTMAASLASSGILVAMHVLPAAILIPGLAYTTPPRRSTTYRLAPEHSSTETASMGSGYRGAP